jgi:hypothetical protein
LRFGGSPFSSKGEKKRKKKEKSELQHIHNKLKKQQRLTT